MNFTREPLVETIITPKEGYRLLLRNSKGMGQEEYLLEALEVITMGNGSFYRSLDRPQSFIVPVGDYEVMEVKETKMALKMGVVEHGAKSGQRDGAPKQKEDGERRKDRRSRSRRRREKEEVKEDATPEEMEAVLQVKEEWVPPEENKEKVPRVLIPPPTTLISETLSRYKDTPVYAGAFYAKGEEVEEVEEVEERETTEESEEADDESPMQLREEEDFGLTDREEEDE